MEEVTWFLEPVKVYLQHGVPRVVHHPKTTRDAKLPTRTMGLFPCRQQELQRVFLAKSSTREELSWLLEKEHQSEAGDGQLGPLGCLQPGACGLGRSRLFLYQCPGAPFANALLPSQAFLFAGGKVCSASTRLLGSFSLASWNGA